MSNNDTSARHAGSGKIVLPGGAGYLGRYLTQHFTQQGCEVVILTRRPPVSADTLHNVGWDGKPTGTARYVAWDGKTAGAWAGEFENADAIINMAGRSVNCRYDAQNRQDILDSRLDSTRAVGAAIATCAHPPRLWINSSSATIYRHALDRPMDEATGEIGTGFSVEVCQAWEQAFFDSITPHTRKVALRSAMVFGGGKEGVFEAFQRIVKRGLGGAMAGGQQYISWIHVDDFTRALDWIITHSELTGPINCASPNPLPNRDFLRIFRRVCHQPLGLPATRGMLEIGAFFLGTETELLLKSRRVVPGRLLDSGFEFNFPHWQDALNDIVSKSQEPYNLIRL